MEEKVHLQYLLKKKSAVQILSSKVSYTCKAYLNIPPQKVDTKNKLA